MFGIPKILVVAIVGVFAYRVLFLRRWNQISLAVPVLAALLVAGVAFKVFSERSATNLSGSAADPPASNIAASVPDAGDSPTPVSVHVEETEHGKMLVMPLSQASLARHLGPKGAAALESINSTLPEGLKQAYFMVPLPKYVDSAMPGLHAVRTAISRMTETASRVFPSAGMATDEVGNNLAVGKSQIDIDRRPGWLILPAEDDIVVTIKPDPSLSVVEAQLRHQVAQALVTCAWKEVAPQAAQAVRDKRSLEMTSAAAQSCILDRFEDGVDVNGTRMYTVSALLQFPEHLKNQATLHVQESVQNHRTWTVGATAVSFGLVVILAAGLMQLAGNSRRVVRYVGVPLIALAMLSGVAISGALVERVVANDSIDVPADYILPTTVIDVESQAESNEDLETVDVQYLD